MMDRVLILLCFVLNFFAISSTLTVGANDYYSEHSCCQAEHLKPCLEQWMIDAYGSDFESETLSHLYSDSASLQSVQYEVISSAAEPDKPIPKLTNIASLIFYLSEGTYLNDTMQYNRAIEALTKAISIDNTNREAYIERALSYFELQKFDLALEDYQSAKKLTVVPPFKPWNGASFTNYDYNLYFFDECFPENRSEFSKGLFSGTLEGIKTGCVEFIPSTLSSLAGIGQGLWSFTCSPVVVSQDLMESCCLCVGYLRENSTEEIMQKIIPELRELVEKWTRINDYDKGHKIGFIIGKYGIDIFACTTVLKIAKRYQTLRRSNAFFTLETCSVSTQNKTVIIEQAVARSTARHNLFKDGKVRIHWDKQNKHIPGKHNYLPGNGKILLEPTDIEVLVNIHAGKGQRVIGTIGEANYKERVDFGKIIGEYAKVIPGQPSEYIPTTKGIIIYAKDGTVHLWPSDPGSILK